MQIDPLTFFAQIANFLILVYLLKRFLYAPILNAMDERELRVRQRLEDAEERERMAEGALQEFNAETERLKRMRGEELERVRKEVEIWRQESLRQGREEIQTSRDQWRASLGREQSRFLAELRERAVEQVQQIAREVLSALADSRLEQQIVDRFSDSLGDLTPDQAEELRAKLRHGDQRIHIRTGLPLEGAGQATVRDAIGALAGAEVTSEFAFETDKALICGVELLVGDQKFAWNVADYMNSLQRSFAVALEHEAAHG